MDRLGEEGAEDVAQAMRGYRSLRNNLTSISVNCAEVIAESEKSDLQYERLKNMMSIYYELERGKAKLEEFQKKLANAKFERHAHSYRRAIVALEGKIQQNEICYLDARRFAEEAGLCLPPVDKMPKPEDEQSLSGSIDMADYLAANRLDDDEGQGANVRNIRSLPGLSSLPKEPQMTRWRYGLGGFDEEAEHAWPAAPDEDTCWGDSSSLGGNDSLSVRAGFITEVTDQQKLVEWQQEEVRAREQFTDLPDNIYEGIAILFEE